MPRDPKEGAILRLGAPDVRRYLLATGWRRVQSRVPDVDVFRREGELEGQVFLPLSVDFIDFRPALRRALEEIARVEGRAPEQVRGDLLRLQSDVLRFAVESRETEDGGIGLDDGIALLSGSTKALLAAACSVARPERFHPRTTLREAESFMRACRLRPAERGSFIVTGSFVVTIECGLMSDVAEDEPFGRRATALLVRSIARIVDALQAGDVRALTDPPPGAPVVSANLCEALVEMMPVRIEPCLRIETSWSPLVSAPQHVPVVVRVEGQHRRAIEDVARALRPGARPSPELYVGKVDALLGEPGPDGRMRGEVVLLAQVEDTVLRIHVDLGEDDYVVAGRAHLEARYVSIRGRLLRGPRVHRLGQTSGLTIVEG